jgi:[protein-PII] uridylyltransferase
MLCMPQRFDQLPNRRAIVDRRRLADALAALPGDPATLRREATLLLKQALDEGRAEIARRLAEHPTRGNEIRSCGSPSISHPSG